METYRSQQLNMSRKELDSARVRYETAATKKKKREAADDVEFWGNKVAFFANLRHGSFDGD